jgi:hypothetical protein
VQAARPDGTRRRGALKRTALSLLVVLGAYAAVWGYFQWKALKVRAELAKKLEPVFAEGDRLQKLRDVDLNPTQLSLAGLEEKFQQPSVKLPGAKNSTKLGWVCEGQECAIWASFLVPFGQEIPPTAAPVIVLLDAPFFQYPHHLAIGGISLGETAEDMQKFCQTHGYKLEMGKNKISWDGEWSVAWAEKEGKISLILFANEKTLKDAKIDSDGNAAPAAGGNRGSGK